MKLRHKRMARAAWRFQHKRFAKWWTGDYEPTFKMGPWIQASHWHRQFRSVR